MKQDGEVIEIIKITNFSNAAESCSFYYGLREMGCTESLSNELGDFITKDSITRIILTGDLNNYTIQSSFTVNKIAVSPMLMKNKQRGIVVTVLNMTLSDVSETIQRIFVGYLVYNYE